EPLLEERGSQRGDGGRAEAQLRRQVGARDPPVAVDRADDCALVQRADPLTTESPRSRASHLPPLVHFVYETSAREAVDVKNGTRRRGRASARPVGPQAPQSVS